jgi:carbamoyltransferase
MNILGLNAFHGDASAALFIDGRLVAAIEEERLNRMKHWAGFPALSARECMRCAGVETVDHVAISRNPRAHFWRKVLEGAKYPASWPRIASRFGNMLRIAGMRRELGNHALPGLGLARVHNVEHHRAHLASAFFVSPFEEAAIASVDGFGDFSSVMWGTGRSNHMQVHGSVQFPHSLGLFYTAFTQFLGFPNYGDEYKMMGLAAYGEPRFAAQVRDVVKTSGAQCRLNLDYFTHHTQGVAMTWDNGAPVIGNVFSGKMIEVFGQPRDRKSELRQIHTDLAASVQLVFEENYFNLLNHVGRVTKQKRLCLAGGVALNCAANGKIVDKTDFKEVYVQPAANDSGTSIGAAMFVWHEILQKPREFTMRHAYYGPQFTDLEVREELDSAGVKYHSLAETDLVNQTAEAIAGGNIVGWFQGRMEFGPRALGNRSILADPRRKDMKDVLNKRIKYREPFRPFCPSVLAEAVGDFFETSQPAPFMVMAYRIKPERQAQIPAVTHADGTGRLQTVERDANPLYWSLIRRFGEITGVPMLLNTSFNENEPVVSTPAQALDCFLRTNMDVLVAGSYLLLKSENDRLRVDRRVTSEVTAAI